MRTRAGAACKGFASDAGNVGQSHLVPRRLLAAGDAEHALAALGEALALWRGAPLADFTYEEFAQSEIARLEEERLVTLEARIDAELALDRGEELGVPAASARAAPSPS